MSEDPEAPLRISIVIPTCRRPSRLASCLACLAAQTLPRSAFEIIVVDDAGTSDPKAVSSESGALEHVQLIRHAKNSGAAAARNTGARAAQASLIAFIDDDCIAEADWAESLLCSFDSDDGSAFAGAVIVSDPHPATDRVTQLLSAPATASDGFLDRVQSANLALSGKDFLELGGFDERFRGAGYEDYEFCRRWRAAGHRIVAVPEAVVHHARETTLAGFWRQHYRYGKGAYLLYGGDEGSPRPSLISTWRRLTRTVSAGDTLFQRIQHTGLVGLSQVAMVAGISAARVSKS